MTIRAMTTGARDAGFRFDAIEEDTGRLLCAGNITEWCVDNSGTVLAEDVRVSTMTGDVEQQPSPYDLFSDALRSRGPTLNLLFEQARISPSREGDTIVRDVFAGAIVAILHEMVKEFWLARNGSKGHWKRLGPQFGGYSVPQILAALLDNFRCSEQWDLRKAEDLAQERSVKILAAVLGIPLKKNAKRPPFRGNVCWAVLEAITAGNGYARLDAMVREFATQLDAVQRS